MCQEKFAFLLNIFCYIIILYKFLFYRQLTTFIKNR